MMNSDTCSITVISEKYDGSIGRTWKCELLSRTDNEVVLRGHFEKDVNHPQLGWIDAGTISYEYFWLDRWYNIFRFHQPTGELRNHYCNITLPPRVGSGTVTYTDLDIDLLVWPNAQIQVLDAEEFKINSDRFLYPEDLLKRVDETLAELIELARNSKLPV